jgi:dTDP-4-dehydrorhamnose reductase
MTHCANPQEGSLHFDVRTTSLSSMLMRLPQRPVAAVIALAIATIDECARNPQATRAINVEGISQLIDQLQQLDILPVFVSSDGVFDGTRAFWEESDAACPILEYGRQKCAIEQQLMAARAPWLIVRLPKLLSPRWHPRCLLSGWVAALGRSQSLLCATDQFFTPASCDDVAAAVVLLIRQRAQGIYHLGGPERLSRRELLGEVASEYQKFLEPRAHIVDCRLQDIPVLEPRPLDTSLMSARFAQDAALRFTPASELARQAVRAYFSENPVA